ncbi:MAG: hypothetical protein LBS84_00435 [Clostridiales bacterium]|jgi:hypothetical protein|nr:hypothetical protein [Clostridiales bacterium]
MKKNAMLIVSGLMICCLNAPLSAFAASEQPVSAATAVSSERPEKARRKAKHKIDVDALVKDNVISKETGGKVKGYLKEHHAQRKAEKEKVKNLSDEDRKAYFKSKHPDGKPDIWADMAAAGVITQDEAAAIKAALPERPECKDKK